MSDEFAIRAAGLYHKRDGYLTNLYDGKKVHGRRRVRDSPHGPVDGRECHGRAAVRAHPDRQRDRSVQGVDPGPRQLCLWRLQPDRRVGRSQPELSPGGRQDPACRHPAHRLGPERAGHAHIDHWLAGLRGFRTQRPGRHPGGTGLVLRRHVCRDVPAGISAQLHQRPPDADLGGLFLVGGSGAATRLSVLPARRAAFATVRRHLLVGRLRPGYLQPHRRLAIDGGPALYRRQEGLHQRTRVRSVCPACLPGRHRQLRCGHRPRGPWSTT